MHLAAPCKDCKYIAAGCYHCGNILIINFYTNRVEYTYIDDPDRDCFIYEPYTKVTSPNFKYSPGSTVDTIIKSLTTFNETISMSLLII